jgi:hypothetical protein
MGIELVLNNLSFEPLAPDKAAARQRVAGFQRAASAAMKMGANRFVRCPENFHRKFLATGYSMEDWLKDEDVDEVLRKVLKSWFTKSPYWKDDHDLEKKVHSRMFEFAGRENATGMGVASLLNGLGVSFLSDEIWNRSSVEIRVLTELFSGEEALTQDENVSVRHVSHSNHLEVHKQWVKECLTLNPKDGKELWDRRKEWLPSLDFCEKTEAQLIELPRQMLSSVTEHLAYLQKYCQNWTAGSNFDPSQFPPKRIETETQITLQKYGAERTFKCPDDGIEYTFSWHVRISPAEWRIYFEPMPATNHMIIGYIGAHLRTAKFNH